MSSENQPLRPLNDVVLAEETTQVTEEEMTTWYPSGNGEIFLDRMVMCRRAAEKLGCVFKLRANGNKLC